MRNWKSIGEVTLHDCVHLKYDLKVYSSLKEFVSSWEFYYEIRNCIHDVPSSSNYIQYENTINRLYQVGFFLGLNRRRFWLTDECGLVIPLWKINETFENLPNVRHKRRHYGYGRYGKSRYYRRPKTTAERRENVHALCDEDIMCYNVKIRKKRVGRNLPSNWDDILRSDRKTRRNWKNRRKTQYK